MAESTEHVPWRQLDTSMKVQVIMLVLVVATIVLLHDGSDVLLAIVAALILSAEVDHGRPKEESE